MKRTRVLFLILFFSVIIAIMAWSKEIVSQLKEDEGHFVPQKARKESSLSITVKQSDIEQIESLIDNGWDVNALDEKGISALQYAVITGDIDKVRLLLQHGADINYIGSFMSPLCVATSINKIQLIKLLIENGADIKGVEQGLLFTSTSRGNIEAIELFIAHGADVDVVWAEDRGKTPIFDAIYGLNVETMKTLIKHNADVNHQDEDSETPLHIAIALHFDEGVELLLEHGADLEVKTKNDGLTPLHEAVLNGDKEIVELLLKYNANVNAINTRNQTPLNIATYSQSIVQQNSQTAIDSGEVTAEEIAEGLILIREITKRLIDHGAQISIHDAVLLEDMNHVKEVLEKGADINAKDFIQMTALHHAVGTDQLQMCEYLLQEGADVNIEAQNRMTPLDMAIDNKNSELVKLLEDYSSHQD